ncbi:MAG TPA: sulfurtransferase [Holophagaceae bacterium]|nr:sulfurtransferase [Holophagaceae bacterium]
MASPILAPEDLLPVLGEAVLLDCRPRAAYDEGHLPGAIHVDTDAHLSRATEAGFDPAQGGRHPLPDLKAFCAQVGRWGIQPDSWVVVYDGHGGANAAARCWWMLRSLGHEKLQVLDGGLAAMVELGVEPTRVVPTLPEGVAAYPATHWRLTTVDIDVVEKLARHPEWKVVDVRAGVRYRGEQETLDPVAGHIPGALNLPYEGNLDARGRFKPKAELREIYEALMGDTRADHTVFSCGSGVTACHGLLAMLHAGLGDGVLYVGSWSEWCRSGKPQASGA